MAFSLTLRNATGNGTSSSATQVSGSFTPTANSRLFVFAVAERAEHVTAQSWSISNTGGLSFTLLDTSTIRNWAGDANFATNAVGWYADVGGSPSSMTVTVDPFEVAETAFIHLTVFDVTGYDTGTPFAQASVDNGAEGDGGNSVSGTLTLGGSPTSGNLVVAMFGVGCDATGAASTPTGYSVLNSATDAYTHTAIFYHVSTTTAAVTSSDLGQQVGNWGGIIFEMTLGGGGGITGTFNKTLSNLSLSSQGSTSLSSRSAILNTIIPTLSLSSQGKVAIKSSLSKTLPNLSLSSAGIILPSFITGTLSRELSNLSIDFQAKNLAKGTLDKTIDNLSLNSSVKINITSLLDANIQDIVVNSTASVHYYEEYWGVELNVNQELYVTFLTAGRLKLWARIVNPSGGGTNLRGYYCDYDGSLVSIHRYNDVGGIDVELDSTSFTFQNNDKIWFYLYNDIIRVYYYRSGNWTNLLDITDGSPYLDNGYIGFSTNDSSVVLDDFGGGNLSVDAILNKEFDNLTITGIGKVSIGGILSKTFDNLTVSSIGQVLNNSVLAQLFDNIDIVSSGIVLNNAILSKTIDPILTNFTANTSFEGISGIANIQLDTITTNILGQVSNNGIFDKLIDNLSIVSSGSISVSGNLNKTLDDITVSISGQTTNNGILSKSLDILTINATGTISNNGILEQTLDNISIVSSGQVPNNGIANVTLGNLSIASTGAVANNAVLDQSIGDIVLLSTVSNPISGQSQAVLVATLPNIGISSDGKVQDNGSANITLDNLSFDASGRVLNYASSVITFDNIVADGTGNVLIYATLTRTLDPISLSSEGTNVTPSITGALDATIDNITISSLGNIPVVGSASILVDDLFSSIAGTVSIVGTLNQTLDNLGLVANDSTVEIVYAILNQTIDPLTMSTGGYLSPAAISQYKVILSVEERVAVLSELKRTIGLSVLERIINLVES